MTIDRASKLLHSITRAGDILVDGDINNTDDPEVKLLSGSSSEDENIDDDEEILEEEENDKYDDDFSDVDDVNERVVEIKRRTRSILPGNRKLLKIIIIIVS